MQIGGVYATFCQEKGILLQKYCDRNERCIAILLKVSGSGVDSTLLKNATHKFERQKKDWEPFQPEEPLARGSPKALRARNARNVSLSKMSLGARTPKSTAGPKSWGQSGKSSWASLRKVSAESVPLE